MKGGIPSVFGQGVITKETEERCIITMGSPARKRGRLGKKKAR